LDGRICRLLIVAIFRFVILEIAFVYITSYVTPFIRDKSMSIPPLIDASPLALIQKLLKKKGKLVIETVRIPI